MTGRGLAAAEGAVGLVVADRELLAVAGAAEFGESTGILR